jgi:hypothetical protein
MLYNAGLRQFGLLLIDLFCCVSCTQYITLTVALLITHPVVRLTMYIYTWPEIMVPPQLTYIVQLYSSFIMSL